MGILCQTAPSEIQDLGNESGNCENFGTPVKVILQRTRKNTDNSLNLITIATTNPNILATWTALNAATDDTKVQYSPTLHATDLPPGEKREHGGGDDTAFGIPIILGEGFAQFTGEILTLKQSIIANLKTFQKQENGNISVFLINADGLIAGVTDDLTTPTTFRGFPIDQFFVGSKGLGKRSGVDKNMIYWAHKENWSDKFHVVTPSDFDALVELTNS